MLLDIYKDKRVLITGHTGFKGAWLSQWLNMLGADVQGIALEPNTNPSLYSILNINEQINSNICDIRNSEKLEKLVININPEIIFHLAAQPLVRLSYSEPVSTYEINVIGTLNVLEAARKVDSVKAVVNITTDKCYENIEDDYAYKEGDKLGGHDMYSSSKACSEILTSSYRSSFLQTDDSFLLASVRAGNVIGGGDWAQDRLIPDCIRALAENKPIVIRSPHAVRPWQHVLEPLSGYLRVGELLLSGKKEYADCYNFGPSLNGVLTVKEVVELVIDSWGSGKLDIQEDSKLHEATLLQLDITKAQQKLDWKPKLSAESAIGDTVKWYKEHYNSSSDMVKFTKLQIKEFIETNNEM